MNKFLFAALAAAVSVSAWARYVFVAPGAPDYDPAHNPDAAASTEASDDLVVEKGRNGFTWETAYPDLVTALKYTQAGDLVCMKVGDYRFDGNLVWPPEGVGPRGGGRGVAQSVLGGFVGASVRNESGKVVDRPGKLADDGRVTRFVYGEKVVNPFVSPGPNSWWASFANIESSIPLPRVWISGCMDFMRHYYPAKLTGSVNAPNDRCKVGDKLVFTFKVDWFVTTGRLLLVRMGDDGVYDEKMFRTDRGDIVYETTAGAPGSVMVFTSLLGEDGNGIGATGTDAKPLKFNIGVIAGADEIGPCKETIPADFAEFWQKTLAAVRAEAPGAANELKGRDNIFAYDCPCPGGRPATGYYSVPKSAAAKSMPAVMELGAWNPGQRATPPGVRKDAIVVSMSVHGQRLDGDKKYFDAEKNRLNGYFVNDANAYAERSAMYGIVCRLLRTIEMLKTIPEWNGELTISGYDQGGYLALVAAALEPAAVKGVEADEPWLADIAFTRMGRMGGRTPSLTNGSRYFDLTSFAPMVKCPVKLVGGLLDTECSPAGIQCVYNLLGGEKSIDLVQRHGHWPMKK